MRFTQTQGIKGANKDPHIPIITLTTFRRRHHCEHHNNLQPGAKLNIRLFNGLKPRD